MKFNGGKSIISLDGTTTQEVCGKETRDITVGRTLAAGMMSLINDPARTKLTTEQCYALAQKLYTSEEINLTMDEATLCVLISKQLPVKLAHPCLKALEE